MNIAWFYDESISNGLGWRAVLFVSGCPHHCPGCHNKEAQDFNFGKKFNEEEILEKIKNNSILKGITISGGEPLCRENIKEVCNFIKDVKKVKKDFNVWCYSGYTYEELCDPNHRSHCSATEEILSLIDILVDGKFVEEKKNLKLKFRGSENQRLIDMNKTRTQHKIVLLDI